jgi:hypothetical protein
MTAGTYRKNPVIIEAIQFNGDNEEEIQEFTGSAGSGHPLFHLYQGGANVDDNVAEVFDKLHDTWVGVKNGQWIIRGLKGEYYPCDDSVFRESYTQVDEPPTPIEEV